MRVNVIIFPIDDAYQTMIFIQLQELNSAENQNISYNKVILLSKNVFRPCKLNS
jgi:hypothetical protein